MKNPSIHFLAGTSFSIAWLLIFFASTIVENTGISSGTLIGLALVFFCLSFLGVRSRANAAWNRFSSHSDPDVAALAEGRIDIAEYRKRKERGEKDIKDD